MKLNAGNWQLMIDGYDDSWWDYKYDAIERIIEILNIKDDFKYNFNNEDIYIDDIKYLLDESQDDEFYDILNDIKNLCNYKYEIELYNILNDDDILYIDDEYDDY